MIGFGYMEQKRVTDLLSRQKPCDKCKQMHSPENLNAWLARKNGEVAIAQVCFRCFLELKRL